MKSSDRAIIFVIPVILVLLGFYFMVLAPKRQEASKLNEDIAALETSIDQQEQVAAFAEQARKDFPRYYARMVVLGKAVPESADSASMLVQLDSISRDAGVQFQSMELGEGVPTEAGATETPPPTTEGTAPAPTDGTVPAETPTAAVPATEAAAATVPIGAGVGPAGLPTLPYDYTFEGDFFQIADFISGVDRLIHLKQGAQQVAADGRLLTIDGFSLQGGRPGASPILEANFVITSFVTPSGETLTLGASPGGPAPAITADATQVSGEVVP